MTTRLPVDLYQGTTDGGARFGYVHGDDGGYFFTWRDTLEATLASIEEDAQDGDGGIDVADAEAYLRSYLPTTATGRRMWSAEDAD